MPRPTLAVVALALSLACTLRAQAQETRIAVNAANTPGDSTSLHRITQPGSYYLTGNITGLSGRSGIVIATSGVTLDLNGFELVGVPGSLSAVVVSTNSLSNHVIRNGTVRSWGGAGVSASGKSTIVRDLAVSACAGTGVSVFFGAQVRDCVITACGSSYGLYTGPRCTVAACTVQDCPGSGFMVQFGSTLVDCTAASNTEHGFIVTSDCTVRSCTSTENGASGFASGSGTTMIGCTSNRNAQHGIDSNDAATITDCTCRLNSLHGIVVLTDSRVTRNHCNKNGNGVSVGAGIYVRSTDNHLEDNTLDDNDIGFLVDTGGNFIARNTAASNDSGNYQITGTQTIGPIITATGTISTTNPWANFSF